MAVKVYKFKNYIIRIYSKDDKIPEKPEGFLSLCRNDVRPEQGVEIVGEGFSPCVKEWVFCHLINLLEQSDYKVIVEVVK